MEQSEVSAGNRNCLAACRHVGETHAVGKIVLRGPQNHRRSILGGCLECAMGFEGVMVLVGRTDGQRDAQVQAVRQRCARERRSSRQANVGVRSVLQHRSAEQPLVVHGLRAAPRILAPERHAVSMAAK